VNIRRRCLKINSCKSQKKSTNVCGGENNRVFEGRFGGTFTLYASSYVRRMIRICSHHGCERVRLPVLADLVRDVARLVNYRHKVGEIVVTARAHSSPLAFTP
jgi:hypothetical protein